MEIWLDTADLDLIQQARLMGIVYGVTTNPSIVAKSKQGLEELLEKILEMQNGPVTAQVTANEASKMIEQGEALFNFSNRMIVKIPVTTEGYKAIHALSEKKIPTMATAVFHPNQVLLAASSGSTYIAPYFSHICEADMDGIQILKAMLHLLERYKFPAKLIAASLKSGEQVRECMDMGTHAVTLNKEVFASFIADHPQTKKSVDRFANDWKTAKARRSLPF